MPIRFRCPDCRAKIKVPEQYAGQLGVCPTCRKRTTIPAASDPEFAVESGAQPAAEDAERKALAVQHAADIEPQAETPARASEVHVEEATAPERNVPAPAGADVKDAGAKNVPAFIRFRCPNCEKPTGFPSALAGQPATCPLCKQPIMVPDESGGDSFVVGALREGSKALRSAAARTPVSRVTSGVPGPDRPSPAPVVAVPAGGRPSYVLMALGGAILLVLVLVVGIFVGGMGRNSAVDRQAAAVAVPPAATSRTVSPLPAQPASVDRAVRQDEPAAQSKAKEVAAPVHPVSADPDGKPERRTTPQPPTQVNRAAPEKPVEEKKEGTPSAPFDPAARVPRSTPASRAGEDEDEAPTRPSGSSKDAVRNLLDATDRADEPAQQSTPAEPTTIAPVPVPPPCAKCFGCGYLPLPTLRPYVYTYGEKPPDPALMVPWAYCDQCMKDLDNNELLAGEAERFARTMAKNAEWDKIAALANIKLVHVETRNVLIHTDLPLATAKQTALMLEKLCTFLMQKTRSCLLVQTRPDTCEQVILGSAANFTAMTYELEKQIPGGDWALRRQASAFAIGTVSIANAEGSGGPEPLAIHQLSRMLLFKAGGNAMPQWLREGFSAYCENAMTKRNLCYSFAYEKNQVKFGPNWNQEIRKYAALGQLKQWDGILSMDLIGMKALDYLTVYSMVSFLMSDPKRFVSLVSELRDGTQSAAAIEKVYGRPLKDLQVRWVNWAVQQR